MGYIPWFGVAVADGEDRCTLHDQTSPTVDLFYQLPEKDLGGVRTIAPSLARPRHIARNRPFEP